MVEDDASPTEVLIALAFLSFGRHIIIVVMKLSKVMQFNDDG